MAVHNPDRCTTGPGGTGDMLSWHALAATAGSAFPGPGRALAAWRGGGRA
jgi:hypothetical protein